MWDVVRGWAIWGPYLLLLGLVVWQMPLRHRRVIVAKRVLPFALPLVWTALKAPTANNVGSARDRQDPKIMITDIDASGGHRTHIVTSKMRELVNIPNCKSVEQFIEADGKSDPFGPNATHTEEVRVVDGGTEVTLTFEGLLWNLHQYYAVRRGLWKEIDRAEYTVQTGGGARATPAKWRSAALWSALAVGSFVALFGWTAALAVIVCLLIHEFGHYIAFLAMGHPAPSITLIPLNRPGFAGG